MKRIVVYQSNTGFTAKYASWIAEELACELKEYKMVKADELISYDMVIYGGWIMGDIVYGYDKVKALNLKNVVVFGVGMSVSSEELAKKIANKNKIPTEQFFYFEGGYNPKKVGFLKKIMMNMVKKSIEKKAEKTSEDIHILETFQGADNTKQEYIETLVQYVGKRKRDKETGYEKE